MDDQFIGSTNSYIFVQTSNSYLHCHYYQQCQKEINVWISIPFISIDSVLSVLRTEAIFDFQVHFNGPINEMSTCI